MSQSYPSQTRRGTDPAVAGRRLALPRCTDCRPRAAPPKLPRQRVWTLVAPPRPERPAPVAEHTTTTILVLERLLHDALQFAALVQLADDVAAADELAVHVDLRDRRPVGEALDRVALLGRAQNVDRVERLAEVLKDLRRRRREPALRGGRCTFPVHHHLFVAAPVLDFRYHVFGHE